MAISRSGIDNTKTQEMIALKIKENNEKTEGKLSDAAIKAEFARVFLKAGKKQDEIDFLVYGIDNT
ncbi:MAG: hypothetical protein LBB36_02990 [Fibromonadaceae bacterium]|jgi:hypothetical protein|nr:hypothetical protein [Fibromonadaceae bacterium]